MKMATAISWPSFGNRSTSFKKIRCYFVGRNVHLRLHCQFLSCFDRILMSLFPIQSNCYWYSFDYPRIRDAMSALAGGLPVCKFHDKNLILDRAPAALSVHNCISDVVSISK